MNYEDMVSELMALVEKEETLSFSRTTKERILPRGHEILGSESLTTCLFEGNHFLLSSNTPIIVVADDDSKLVSWGVLEVYRKDGAENCQLHLSNGDAYEISNGIAAQDIVRLMAGLSSKPRLFDFRVSVFRNDKMKHPSKLSSLANSLSENLEKLAVDWPLSETKGNCYCHCWAFCNKGSTSRDNRAKCNAFTGSCHGSCSGDGKC